MILSEVKVNSEYRITQVGGKDIKRRLLDMGFTPGCKIKVTAKAPFSSTLLINIRGIDVALRESATKVISVEDIQ